MVLTVPLQRTDPAQSCVEPNNTHGHLGEVARLFLRLGIVGFGGPAAHVALMRQETVDRRGWVTEQQFLDLLGASNLIPGPSSTEMGMFLGHARAGRWGLVIAGTLFILPAMLIVLALAWLYSRYGDTGYAGAILSAVKPAVVAIVAQAIVLLARRALRRPLLIAVALAAASLYLFGLSPILPIFGAGVGLLLLSALPEMHPRWNRTALAPVLLIPGVATTSTLWTVFITFAKIGVVTYGSGYVLLAFLQADVVTHLHWLTSRQLLDAVAIGQVTPGPVFTTATFIGYQVAGVPGALLATLGIFLPSFVLAAVVYPLIPRLRASKRASAFLDGVNAGALGLMAGVTLQLAKSAVLDVPTAAIGLVSGILLLRFRVNAAWVVCGAAVIGLAHYGVTGMGM